MLARTAHIPYRRRRHRLSAGGDTMDTPLVVVVDDDAPFLELMDDLLREAGCRAVCCATARDGLTVVGRTRPDLVILDVWMETRDAGWQLLDHLRRDPRNATVPVIICSADHAGLVAHADTLHARGCSALAKPFDSEDLFTDTLAVRAGAPRW